MRRLVTSAVPPAGKPLTIFTCSRGKLVFCAQAPQGFRVARATGAAAWWRFGWSVVPALIGWICLLLEPAAGVLGLAGALLICLLVDEAFARNESSPAWFMPLRRLLTVGSASSLLAAGLLS